MDINFAEEVKMRARAIDYSVYSEESLFMELDSTKEQIAELENKKSQIEQALHSIPTDETADALKNPTILNEHYASHRDFVESLKQEMANES